MLPFFHGIWAKHLKVLTLKKSFNLILNCFDWGTINYIAGSWVRIPFKLEFFGAFFSRLHCCRHVGNYNSRPSTFQDLVTESARKAKGQIWHTLQELGLRGSRELAGGVVSRQGTTSWKLSPSSGKACAKYENFFLQGFTWQISPTNSYESPDITIIVARNVRKQKNKNKNKQTNKTPHQTGDITGSTKWLATLWFRFDDKHRKQTTRTFISALIATFPLENEYDIEYEYDFQISNQWRFQRPHFFVLFTSKERSSRKETSMWYDNVKPANWKWKLVLVLKSDVP